MRFLEAAREAGPLIELFTGASVICSIAGPSSKHGPKVVGAGLGAGGAKRMRLAGVAAACGVADDWASYPGGPGCLLGKRC